MTEQGDPLGMPGINGGKPTGPGSVVEMVVEGDDVFIVENRKGAFLAHFFFLSFSPLIRISCALAETLLNEDSAVKPSFKSTWLPQQIIPYLPPGLVSAGPSKPKKTYKKPTAGSLTGATSGEESGATSDDATSGGEGTPKVPRGPGKGIEGMGKVGGRRRKTVPRPAPKPEAK
jgi:DnaJ family protein C protein 1